MPRCGWRPAIMASAPRPAKLGLTRSRPRADRTIRPCAAHNGCAATHELSARVPALIGAAAALMSITTLRRDWLSNVRGDLLAGLVVALALIP